MTLYLVQRLSLVVPMFLGSTLLIFALPPVIYAPLLQAPLQNLKQMAFPTLALALSLVAVVMRMTRSSMLEVLEQDYIQTARPRARPSWRWCCATR